MTKIYLASDNFAPVHPLVIEAMGKANEGYSPSYGLDVWTEKLEKLMLKVFKKKGRVLIVPSGTGANVLALKLSCQRFESVICTDIAHLQYQESGAPESIVGCKLLTVPHRGGKITPDLILSRIQRERAFGRHSTSPRVLSITQPTEVGTVYTSKEIKLLSKLCKEEKLILHMDGSRLYNAAVALDSPLNKVVSDVDILSLGGTKNGLMCAEALIIFNVTLQKGLDYLQKQTLQLVSKMRYLSAQFIPFFEGELWHPLARQANQKAQEIANLLETIPSLRLSYPVQTNQIFFSVPLPWIPIIQEKVHCYVWDKTKNEIRFTTSWNTSEIEVEVVRSLAADLSRL